MGTEADFLLRINLLQAFLFSAMSPKPLYTQSGKIEPGVVYEYETDFIAERKVSDWMTFLLEFDTFFTGDFFLKEETIFRILAGVDIAF